MADAQLLGLLAVAVIAGAFWVAYLGLSSAPRPTPTLFRPIGERDVTFRPLGIVSRPAPPAPEARASCWICGRPKDGHQHERP